MKFQVFIFSIQVAPTMHFVFLSASGDVIESVKASCFNEFFFLNI